jgi:predicted Zn-dependent protease
MFRFQMLIPLGTALVVSACSTNPVSNKPEVTFTSTAEEKAIGADQARQVDEYMGLAGSAQQQAYIAEIGRRLAASSPRQDVTYTFKIVDMPEPNAFALPGGPVYLSRGLLALSNSEDELACVIGHEIGHVAARHHAQQQTRQAIASPFTAVTGITGALTGIVAPRIGAAISGAGQMAAGSILASYNRDQERESDEIGIKLAAENGWDPEAMSRFLEALSREEVLERGTKRDATFLDSHPATTERMQATAAEGARLTRANEAPIAPNHAAFLAKLDGLVIGTDPGAGIFKGDRFMHPKLGISMKFPDNWATQKSHTFVAAADPKGTGIVMVDSPGMSDDPLRGAAAVNRKLGFSLGDVKSGKIAGMPAARFVAQAQSRQGPIAVDFTWLVHEGRIYQFMGAMPAQLYVDRQDTFLAIAQSFRPMTRAEISSVTERRLRIVKARQGETLRRLLERTDAAVSPAQAAVANAMEMETVLTEGQLVKIVKEQPFTQAGR